MIVWSLRALEGFGRPIPQGQCHWRPEGRRYPARASSSTSMPTSSTARASSTKEALMAASTANIGIMIYHFPHYIDLSWTRLCKDLGLLTSEVLSLANSNINFNLLLYSRIHLVISSRNTDPAHLSFAYKLDVRIVGEASSTCPSTSPVLPQARVRVSRNDASKEGMMTMAPPSLVQNRIGFSPKEPACSFIP